MKKYINFDLNYNGKLSCQYFTTIRGAETITEKDLCVNDIVDIRLRYVSMYSAEIVNIEYIDLDHLTSCHKTLLTLDTGWDWRRAVDLFRCLYKSNVVAIITIRKI